MKVSKNVSIAFSFILVATLLATPFFIKKKNADATATEAKMAGDIVFANPATIGAKKINIAFAKTEAEREQGLSDTQPLTSNEGMLFVFDSPNIPGFWMKDMNYPLDIVWIDQDKKVIGVSANLDPKTYPQVFSPTSPILYVLELPAGFYKTNNIKVGDIVTF